jgi:hypothetical protein
MNKVLSFLIALFVLPSCLSAQQTRRADNWGPWVFLMGQWEGDVGGQPGPGTGEFAFYFELDGKVMVRKSRMDFPATKDRPAFSHEDLMVIYLQPGESASRRAIYFDNEDHVIEYTAEFSAERGTFTFLSEAAPSTSRQRLTYTREGADRLSIKFEIAPPGKPEAFSTHVEGSAHRKN